jgi:hypothetical protein
MISKLSILLLAAVFVFGQSCSVYDVMVSGTKVGAAEGLWGDVPQVEGAKKIDVALPPSVRSEVEGLRVRDLSYVAYSTGRTASDVGSIYGKDRMADAGWSSASKCMSGESLKDGAVCVYYRMPDAANNVLAIHLAENPVTKETVVYYMRFKLILNDDQEQLAQ